MFYLFVFAIVCTTAVASLQAWGVESITTQEVLLRGGGGLV